MQAQYEASKFGSPDSLSAAAHFIGREYGHGYRIGIAANTGALTIFEVRHSDGSAFNIVADRWGNVKTVPDHPAASELLLREMHRNAVTA